MAVTGKSGKNEGRKPNRYRPFPKRGGMHHHQPPMPFLPPPPWQVRQPKSSDDRHVMAKHAGLYPSNLPAFQKMVSACEKALKLVSDELSCNQSTLPQADENCHRDEEEGKNVSTEEKTGDDESSEKEGASSAAKPKSSTNDQNKRENNNTYRSLKGVQRVGVFGHGLLLEDDTSVDLVALSAEKPTETLLRQIYESFPTHLSAVTEEKYDLKLETESAAMFVTLTRKPTVSCRIILTSPQMRSNPASPGEHDESAEAEGNNNGDHKNTSGANSNEQEDAESAQKDRGEEEEEVKKSQDKKSNDDHSETTDTCDPPDVLNKEICLEALAQLRRVKWFQARARGLPNCVIILRILRDLSKRDPQWANMNLWAMELLVQKCISSVRVALGPGNALRRVFECISTGMILSSGHGLYDPCEREPTDPLAAMNPQDREDITASAQHMLRLMAFRRIRKVLDMEPLPTPRRKLKPRKRKRASGEGTETNASEKKDKKENEGDGQNESEDAVVVDDDDEDELLEDDDDDEDCVVEETTDA